MICEKDQCLCVASAKMLKHLYEVDKTSFVAERKEFTFVIEDELKIGLSFSECAKVETGKEYAEKILFADVNDFIGMFKDAALLDKAEGSADIKAFVKTLLSEIVEKVYGSENAIGEYLKFTGTIDLGVELGNNEPAKGMALAKRIPDGRMMIGIREGKQVNIIAKDHKFTIVENPEQHIKGMIQYDSAEIASGLLSKKLNIFENIAHGRYVAKGMVPMIDTFEKILFYANKMMF